MLTTKVEDDPSYKLLEGEVLIAINFNASEPIINEIETGKTISVVSTSKNKTFSNENIYLEDPEGKAAQERTILSTNYIEFLIVLNYLNQSSVLMDILLLEI
ncbi:MAG: hypothetical protein U5N58_05845 [Actinomycetota bacterium]|nr:hypothetical protein [Actinomycetota bacterium]